MNKIEVDADARAVTAEAGVTYGQLGPYLDSKGFALHNLASLPHISVAGACSTATHGSGEKNGNLASAVSALEMITAAGEIVKLSRKSDGEAFQAAVVASWRARRDHQDHSRHPAHLYGASVCV